MYPTFQQTFVYKMYTKYLYIYKIYPTFVCKRYPTFVYKMHPTLQQTFEYILYAKFYWHSSFDFVNKIYAKVCLNVVYILYTSVVLHLVQFLCIKCIYTLVSVWVRFLNRLKPSQTCFHIFNRIKPEQYLSIFNGRKLQPPLILAF